MTIGLGTLKTAVQDLDEDVDPRELRQVIDLLERKFCEVVQRARQRGDHLLSGKSPVSWVARSCALSSSSAADRLCVGEQLESLPKVAEALATGRIGYQAASVICHLRESLGDKSELLDEEEWVVNAEKLSIKNLRYTARFARHVWDADGFERDGEKDYERRWLRVDPILDGMHVVDGLLDPVTGAAFKTALESLASKRGAEDRRSHEQRLADALAEMLDHGLDNGARAQISVTTTLEGLKAELGAAASELQDGIAISSTTVQRLACDSTLCRVLKADSAVIDVGRATRAVSGSQRRALKARYQGCCGPGCDRPINWTSAHHVEFWSRGGPTNVRNLVPLCYYHHRLVHEGGWQVVKAGDEVKFVPPDRLVSRWAA